MTLFFALLHAASAACSPAPSCTAGPSGSGATHPSLAAAFTASCSAVALTGDLTEDVTIDASSTPVCIDGAGFTLTGSGTGSVIHLTGGDLTLDALQVSGGAGAACGGGILVDAAGALTAHELTVQGNTADAGGGLCVRGAADLHHSVILGNSATTGRGGGLLLTAEASTVNLLGATNILLNDAVDGGGIALDGGFLTFVKTGELASTALVDGTADLSDNEAAFDGGGIDAGPGTIVVCETDTVLLANTAELGFGGGYHGGPGSIFASGGGIVDAVTILAEANTAGESGGGLAIDQGGGYFDRPDVLLLRDNTAVRHGGGAAVRGPDAYFGTTTEYPGEMGVVGNRALTGQGGGLWLQDVEADLNHTTVAGNIARRSGGGIHTEGDVGYTVLAYGSVFGNYARGWGGGIFAADGAYVLLGVSTIAENLGRDGGGIFASRGTRLTVNECTIAGNAAGDFSGYASSPRGHQLVTENLQMTQTAIGEAVVLGTRQCGFAPGGTVNGGESMVTHSSCLHPSAPSIVQVASLLVAPLRDGAMAPQMGSPLIDGTTSVSGDEDQLGNPRPVNCFADVGAVEVFDPSGGCLP